MIEQINEYARLGDDGNFKVLVGRKKAKKLLWDNFFLSGKNCSVYGANGVGKSYLKDWLMGDVEGLTGYDELNNSYINNGTMVVFCTQNVVYKPEGSTPEEQAISYWKKTINDFPSVENLKAWFETQEKEDAKKIIENKDCDFDSVESETELQNYLKKLLKAYMQLHVEIRLILDEFGNLKVEAFQDFFSSFKEIVTSSKNLSVLCISREHLSQIAYEDAKFCKDISVTLISLQGFTLNDKDKLFRQYRDYFQIKYEKEYQYRDIVQQFGRAEYYCGMHPASWAKFFEKLDFELSCTDGEITDEVINDVLNHEFFDELKDSVAMQMYDLMKDAALEKGKDRTYLQSFYDNFIKEPQDVNVEELKKLSSNGYIVQIDKKYVDNAERKYLPTIIGDDAYLPISEFCAVNIKKKYVDDHPTLPVPVEPVEKPEVLAGEIEDKDTAATKEDAQPAFMEQVLLMMGNMMDGFMKFIVDMQNRSDKKTEELLDKFLNSHSADMQAFREMISESNKASVENIKNFLEGQAKKDKGNKDIINKMLDAIKEVTNINAGMVEKSLETIKYVTGPSAPSLAAQIEEATKADREEAAKLQQQLEKEQQAATTMKLELQELQQMFDNLKESSKEEKSKLENLIQTKTEALDEANKRADETETKLRESEERVQEIERKYENAHADAWKYLSETKYADVFKKKIDAAHVLEVYKILYTDAEAARMPSVEQIENTLKLLEKYDFIKNFKVAFFMHELFNDMSPHGFPLDYTVLVMMYSRMYESFVKQQHFRMYQLVFPNVKASKNGTQTYGSRSLTYDKLTIGHFSYPISDEENENDAVDANNNLRTDANGNTIKDAVWNRNTLVSSLNTALLNNASAIVELHGESITKIRDIRNGVMHDRTATATSGSEKTPEELLKELLEELFTKSALINISKIRDAFDLRDVEQEVYSDNCPYPDNWMSTDSSAQSKKCNLKKVAFRLADALCKDADLPEIYVVKYEIINLYDFVDPLNAWTSVPRVQHKNNNNQIYHNRKFVKTYQWNANAPLFKVYVECAEEKSKMYKIIMEVNDEENDMVYVGASSSYNFRNRRAGHINWLKRHWNAYVEQCKALEAAEQMQAAGIADAAATAETATAQQPGADISSAAVNEPFLGTEYTIQKTAENESGNGLKTVEGSFEYEQITYTVEFELEARGLSKKFSNDGKAVVKLIEKSGEKTYKAEYKRKA